MNAELLSKALKILEEYSLCDRCLGRMFACLGRGLTNKERGRALKVACLMAVHEKSVNEGVSEEVLRALNALYRSCLDQALEVARALNLSLDAAKEPCYICNGELDAWIEEYAKRCLDALADVKARTFLIGCRLPEDVVEREEEIKTKYALSFSESIKNEVKREVSKAIQRSTSLTPCFENPDVTLLIDLRRDLVELQVAPLLLKGRYWKQARNISQSRWYERYYSVERGLDPLAQVFHGTNVILHAAGREDVDVRMLGTGRPMIVEVKEARDKLAPLSQAESMVNNEAKGLIEVKLEGEARRSDVRYIKEEKARTVKIYRALVETEHPISTYKLKKLEEFFRNRLVSQRTPIRVLHRKPDITRKRTVYEVKARQLSSRLFEAVVRCDGGLYIKELVSGDQGRTRPSFSQVLEMNATCIELDVIAVKL